MSQSLTGGTSAPLAPELVAMGLKWKDMGIPDLYEGCLNAPSGAEISRERGRNVRAMLYPMPDLPQGQIESRTISGKYGAIAIRIVWPHDSVMQGKKPQNTLVYFHGGGFVVGDLDSHHFHAVRLANEAQCVVVNVAYRLAPENRFPCAFDDCLRALHWARENIALLGGDLQKIAVGGDSAGGNLAAAVAIAARDAGIDLAAQLLIYPATNLSRIRSLPEQAYMGDLYDVHCHDWRASPALAPSHVGLAPAILGVGIHDFLYRDNVAYRELLLAANVPLTYREFATLNHGFFSFTAISGDSLKATQLLAADLKSLFLKVNF